MNKVANITNFVISDSNTFTNIFGRDSEVYITFGNRLAPTEFQAHIEMNIWNEFDIIIADEGVSAIPTLSDERLTLRCSASKSIEWRKVDDSTLKWLITLTEKPESNIYSFKIGGLYDEFNWIYQPPLSLEYHELEEFIGNDGDTWIRPVNYLDLDSYSQRPMKVDGSYAVYHKTKRDYIIGQTNYQTGKAFHIYRPKATDSKGDSVWTDLHIENGIYSVTIPQNFLDSATYPIIINDEFGYHTNGGTEGIDSDGLSIYANGLWSPASDGSATQIFGYTRAGGSQTFGIYSNAAGPVPANILKDGAAVASGAVDEWVGGDLDSPLAVEAATSYWLGAQAGDSIAYHYDAGTHTQKITTNQTYNAGTLPNWPGTVSSISNVDYSFYVVYTPSGGAATGFMTLNTKFWG